MYNNRTMTQGFKSIKEIMDDMVTAGNRNYARMSDKNESGMACGFCGRDLVEEVLSSDLDGNRREIVWYFVGFKIPPICFISEPGALAFIFCMQIIQNIRRIGKAHIRFFAVHELEDVLLDG